MNLKLYFIILTLLLISLVSCDLLPMEEKQYLEKKYDISIETVSPVHRGTLNNLPSSFTWDSINSAETYHFQLSTTPEFSGTLLVDETGLTENQYQLNRSLEIGNRYFWRICGNMDNGEISPWYTFQFQYVSADLIDNFEFASDEFSLLQDWTLSSSKSPILQSDEVFEGDFAVQFSNDTSYYYMSEMETTLSIAQDSFVSFYIKKNDNYGNFYVYLDTQRILNIDSSFDWTMVSVFIPEGTHTLSWRYDNSYTSGNAWIDLVTLSEVQDFNSELDEINSSTVSLTQYTRSTEYTPYLQSTEVYHGDYAIKMGNIGQSGTSTLEMEVVITGNTDKILNFNVKKSESSGQYRFYIDSNQFCYTYQQLDWEPYSYYLAPGTYIFEWEYYKSYDSESEEMWIDNIHFDDAPDFSTEMNLINSPTVTVVDYTRSTDYMPFLQSSVLSQGDYAIQMGMIGRSGTSSFEIQVDITGSEDQLLSFLTNKNLSTGNFRFYIDSVEKTNAYSELDWEYNSFLLTPGSHTLKWEHYKYYDDASEILYIDGIEINEISAFTNEDFEVVVDDFSNLNNWKRWGDSLPFIQSSTISQGNNAVQMGDLGQTGKCYLETAIHLDANSQISFFFKKNYNSGTFRFYIDSISEYYTNSTYDWREVTATLSAGEHTLRWYYYKYNDLEDEYLWIDNITITPTP